MPKNIADFGICGGLELSDARMRELQNAVSLSNTRQRAAKLLSARQMSVKELENA